MGPSATDEDMERLRERMEELEALFQVEEEQDGVAIAPNPIHIVSSQVNAWYFCSETLTIRMHLSNS